MWATYNNKLFSVCLYIDLSICVSVFLFFCFFYCLSVYWSVCRSVCQSVCLTFSLSFKQNFIMIVYRFRNISFMLANGLYKINESCNFLLSLNYPQNFWWFLKISGAFDNTVSFSYFVIKNIICWLFALVCRLAIKLICLHEKTRWTMIGSFGPPAIGKARDFSSSLCFND